MTKREKIILSLAGIALLYGLYHFIFATPPRESNSNGERINFSPLKTQLINSLSKINLTPEEKRMYYLLKLKEIRDPFWYELKEAKVQAPSNNEVSSAVFKFTGYLFLGSKRFAIINGREYAEGEPLEESGFSLLKVSRDYIMIKGPGKDNILKIPFWDILEIKSGPKNEQ